MQEARRHIADCIRHNLPINRLYLAFLLDTDAKAVESFIHRTVCDFVMESQGSTGGNGNKTRDGRLKREAMKNGY